jgi:hypothetical protein
VEKGNYCVIKEQTVIANAIAYCTMTSQDALREQWALPVAAQFPDCRPSGNELIILTIWVRCSFMLCPAVARTLSDRN